MNCYCSSGVEFEDCCQPFIRGKNKPATAEQLMRSRYSAYVIVEVEYLIKTAHPSVRKYHDAGAIKDWAESCDWQKLEIISKTLGEAKDKKGTVEFKAHFLNNNNEPQIHHENSNFRKELGKWFYVDGKIF